MFPVIRVDLDELDLNSKSVVKAEEYRHFVEVRQLEQKIIKLARQEYQKEKKRGYEEGLALAKEKEVELMLANASKIIRS